MKKIIKFILILMISIFTLCFVMENFVGEEEAINYSIIITTIGLIIYNIIILIKKICKYNKTGEVSDVSDIVTIMTAILGIKSSRDFSSNLATTPLMVRSTQTFANRVSKYKKVLLCTHVLLHISIISLLFSFIYFVADMHAIGDVVFPISLILLMIGYLLPIICGSYIFTEENYEKFNSQIEFIQSQKSTNVLVYDKEEYKKHMLGRNIILGMVSVLVTIITLYNRMHNEYVGILNLLIFISVPGYMLYILLLKRKVKTMSITFNPLKVFISSNGAVDMNNNYQRKEETIFFDRVKSYKVTKSYVIIYGDIQKCIRSTFNNFSEEKNRRKRVYRIPRTFNNIEVLINELDNIIKNNIVNRNIN